MALRTSSAKVKKIWQGNTTITDFDPFITPANIVVSNAFASQSVSSVILSEIETWLAAHFACVVEPTVKKEEMGDSKMEYALPTMGDGFLSTMYGKMAVSLDPVGVLVNYGKQAATIEAIEGP